MRSQAKETLEIAIPFALSIGAFLVLMGGIFTTTASVAQSFIPYKIASMVAHSLTGSTQCLVLERGLAHKGLLDQNKINDFAENYTESSPPCVKMPCWTFRAIIKDLDTRDEYYFGYKSSDEDYWNGKAETRDEVIESLPYKVEDVPLVLTLNDVDVRRVQLPVLIDVDKDRHLGRLTIDVRPKDPYSCQVHISAIAGGKA